MADTATSATASPSGRSFVLGALALTLLAGAGGGGLGYLLSNETPAVAVAEAVPEGEKAAEAPAVGERVLVPLQAVVTNIAAPATTLLRVEASIVVDPSKVDDQTLLAAEISSDTLAYLRSLELAQIEGARGLLHLREDLKERAQLRSPAVDDYVIQSLIAQ